MISDLLKEAQRRFQIRDVFLCESKIWSNRALALGVFVKDPSVQFTLDPANQCNVVEIPAEHEAAAGGKYFVHHFVGTGLRILTGTPPAPGDEPPEDRIVASITATFLARYATTDSPSLEMLNAFNNNAVHPHLA